eukprot:1413088-Amphidinium_carterae.1
MKSAPTDLIVSVRFTTGCFIRIPLPMGFLSFRVFCRLQKSLLGSTVIAVFFLVGPQEQLLAAMGHRKTQRA